MHSAASCGRHGKSISSCNANFVFLTFLRSEEIGRWPTQQASLFLVNIWQISTALSPTFGGFLTSRILNGLSTAGGSVTLVCDKLRPVNLS